MQVHATWPSSAPVRAFVANIEFPRKLEAFVSPDEWSAVVGVVDRAILAGRPGVHVTVANYAIFLSLVLVIAGVLVAGTDYAIGCTEMRDGTPASSSDCGASKTIGAFTAACLCLAVWLGCVQMPRMSKQWCARAQEELARTGLTNMRSIAPKLEFQLENTLLLHVSLHISPTVSALRQKALDDKLVRWPLTHLRQVLPTSPFSSVFVQNDDINTRFGCEYPKRLCCSDPNLTAHWPDELLRVHQAAAAAARKEQEESEELRGQAGEDDSSSRAHSSLTESLL